MRAVGAGVWTLRWDVVDALRPAVFLDRDDTVIANLAIGDRMAHPGYLYEASLVELLPGAAEGCAMLACAGFALVVVTNQSSVARGWCAVEDVERTNLRVRELLARRGVVLAGVYTSLHSPDGVVGVGGAYASDHAWRKPRGGMIRAAAQDLGLDLGRSWLVGDAQRDVDAALDAGMKAERALVVGEREVRAGTYRARVSDLVGAARVILGDRA